MDRTTDFIYNFFQFLPTHTVYLVLSFSGSYLPSPSKRRMLFLERHFKKRYCRVCGEYIPMYDNHRHYPRQRFFKYRPLYENYLNISEMLYISRTNYRVTSYTQYDTIIVWQNTKNRYCSFRKCLQEDTSSSSSRITPVRYYRDGYFTDIGISSNVRFWFIDEWNEKYPMMKYLESNVFDFCEPNFLWTPDLLV